jgi:hypothetical protein
MHMQSGMIAQPVLEGALGGLNHAGLSGNGIRGGNVRR